MPIINVLRMSFIVGIIVVMAHLRSRFATPLLLKHSKLWPVIGLLGPRQSGKTTLIQNLLGLSHVVSLDDLEARLEASSSPKTFLAKMELPVALDEVQKAPEIFDAIKLQVDKKRIPGRYFLTGSASFSAKLGIRESLTGRIGLVHLHPLTLAELHQAEFEPFSQLSVIQPKKVRFTNGEFLKASLFGGMPVPVFLRDPEQRDAYWKGWLDTTLVRDLARFFKQGYDPDFSFAILNRIGSILREGELPTLKHFKYPARKLRVYLSAMEEIFLLRKIQCHAEGIGKEVWVLMDSGLAQYLMKGAQGEGPTLSLVRHFLWNEWATQMEYQGKSSERIYYKSAQGSLVDAVFDGVPFRLVPSISAVTTQRSWEERPLLGAMKKLGSKFGYLVAPVDTPILPEKKGGIGIIPWSYWS